MQRDGATEARTFVNASRWEDDEALGALAASISGSPREIVRIEGGHYQLGYGPTNNSLATWDLAVRLHQLLRRQGQCTCLELLVNDMAIPSSARQAIRKTFALPDTYLLALKLHAAEDITINVVFERTLKNKSAGYTKSLTFRRDAFKDVDGRWKYNSYDLGCPITLTSRSGVPQCTLMMGMMFADATRRCRHSINFYNAMSRETMERASVVAQEFYRARLAITNCYVADGHPYWMLCEHET